MDDAGFISRVPRIPHDPQVRFRPARRQFPRRRHRADHIVTPLDDDRRNRPYGAHPVQQLIFAGKEPPVDEVVGFDGGQGDGEVFRSELLRALRIRSQETGGALPDGPRPGRGQPGVAVAPGEPPVVRRKQVVALPDGNRLEKTRPLIRVDFAGAVLIEPVNLLPAYQEDARNTSSLTACGWLCA